MISMNAQAQDRLKTMPGYEQYQKMASQINGSVKRGTLFVTWKDGGKAFEYSKDGKRYRFDVEAGKAEEVKPDEAAKKEEAAPAKTGGRRGNRGGGGQTQGNPGRGRQFSFSLSPDGKLKAVYKDRNLFITDDKDGNETAVTTDGSEKDRIKYGTASWVYGEELYQTTAMWWSPDSTKLAYYRFDESKVKDYYLQLGQTQIQDKMNIEPYPKAGTDNPIVDLFVYDVANKKSVRVDARDGKTLEDGVVGYYVFTTSACGRQMVKSCSSIGPTAGRTSWSSVPPILILVRRG